VRASCALRVSARSRIVAASDTAALALLAAMPDDEQCLVCYLLEIFADVVRAVDATKMTAKNCAVVVRDSDVVLCYALFF
jgi:hypothetical protein